MNTEPIRLAFVITELELGGAERCLAELATRLDRERFSPQVYSLAARPPTRVPSVVPILESAGVPVMFLDATRRHGWLRAYRLLADRLAAERIELVQTFLFHANLIGRLAARRARIPHVVSGIRVAERRRRWYLWLDRWTESLVERHVCVSQSVADFSGTKSGLNREKLLVIPNCVDVARFDNATPADLVPLGVAKDRSAILYVGRFDPQKGVDRLIEWAPRIFTHLPSHDLLLVGSGPLEASIRTRIGELLLGGRVHLAGWRRDIPELLKASSILALPSRWEGMANVILEAMAAGRPVVSTDVEGVRELLGNEQIPQIVPKGDPRAFVDALVQLGKDRALADRLGRENRDRVVRLFTIDLMVRAYESLFSSLVGR